MAFQFDSLTVGRPGSDMNCSKLCGEEALDHTIET